MDHIERDKILKMNSSGNIISDLFDNFREAKDSEDEPEEPPKDLVFCPVCGDTYLETPTEIHNGECFFCHPKKTGRW